MSRNYITPNYLFLKVEDTYRAALVNMAGLSLGAANPKQVHHLYLFPEMFVPFTEETLPDLVKYKMGAIGASKEAVRPMYGVPSTEWSHGWRLEGINGFCVIFSEKHIRDMRRVYLDELVEPITSKETLTHIQNSQVQQVYGQMAQQAMANQQQYSATQYTSGFANLTGVYSSQLSGGTYAPGSTLTTTAGSTQGYWSSVGSVLGVI